MSLDGLTRAFHLDLTPYLTPYGQELLAEDQDKSITNEISTPGLTWSEIAKPEYPQPDSIPVFVRTANKLNVSNGTPTVPFLIGQGNGGEEFEGTPGNKPGIGPGDGVMIAGDVRTLAREWCSRGVSVHFTEYQHLGHIEGAAPWLAEATPWLTARFLGQSVPQNCSEIAPGNSLAPGEEGQKGPVGRRFLGRDPACQEQPGTCENSRPRAQHLAFGVSPIWLLAGRSELTPVAVAIENAEEVPAVLVPPKRAVLQALFALLRLLGLLAGKSWRCRGVCGRVSQKAGRIWLDTGGQRILAIGLS